MSLGGRRGRVNIVFVRYEGRPVKKHDFQVSLNAVCRHTLRHEASIQFTQSTDRSMTWQVVVFRRMVFLRQSCLI